MPVSKIARGFKTAAMSMLAFHRDAQARSILSLYAVKKSDNCGASAGPARQVGSVADGLTKRPAPPRLLRQKQEKPRCCHARKTSF